MCRRKNFDFENSMCDVILCAWIIINLVAKANSSKSSDFGFVDIVSSRQGTKTRVNSGARCTNVSLSRTQTHSTPSKHWPQAQDGAFTSAHSSKAPPDDERTGDSSSPGQDRAGLRRLAHIENMLIFATLSETRLSAKKPCITAYK